MSAVSARNTSVFSYISVIKGDITTLEADAIVNAANGFLLGGEGVGVDGAIHRAAGPGLLRECKTMNGCPTGDARITMGYELSTKYVIHTVGPVWRGGQYNEEDYLKSCYVKSMELALNNHCKSIAFPAISCGMYAFPFSRAAKIAFEAVTGFIREHECNIEVIFCCYSQSDLTQYKRVIELETADS